jgi:Rrf2 family iron-sulfur cluster assembly transcriptional regulator
MIYSVGCEYGIRALTKLAAIVPAGQYSLLRDILNGSNLPQHFVGKIFQTLVRAEILVSAKGRGGGFALRRSPDEIRLRDIVEAIDGSARQKRCFLGFEECSRSDDCPNHGGCTSLRGQLDSLLDDTSLAKLVTMSAQRKQLKAKRR